MVTSRHFYRGNGIPLMCLPTGSDVTRHLQYFRPVIDAGAGDHKRAIASQLEYQKRIGELQDRLKAAGSVMALPPARIVNAALTEISAVEDEPLSFDERRPILEKLVDLKMIYDRGTVEITGKVPVAARAYKCDRRIGADPQRQGQYGCGRESGTLRHVAQGVKQILLQRAQKHPSPDFAHLLLYEHRIAERAECGIAGLHR
jgi:hypothetical protein